MDLLFILLVLGAIVATVIGYVIWIVFFVWAVKKGVSAIQTDMDRAQKLIQAYGSLPISAKAQREGQILQLLGQANTHLQQLDGLRRQQYEVKVGELHSMAAQAGIDWTPPSY
jgi:hypothetical protein